MKKYFFILFFISLIHQLYAQPVVNSFTPASGPIGTNVIINGTNFNPTPASNIVYFGAVKAIVIAATTTQLTVTVPAGASFQPITVTTGDLTAYSPQPFVVTFYNSGIGFNGSSFAPRVFEYTAGGTSSVAMGDIDGDGKSDIAETNQSVNTVSVLRNTGTTGTLTFSSSAGFQTASQPYHVALGDIDGDGKLDMAVANFNASSVSVFRNTSSAGIISFAAKIDISVGSNPTCVAIGDLNGDGKPDIVVSSSGGSSVSLRRNTSSIGAISFTTSGNVSTGGNPNAVALGDIDGDGKMDIATANSSANTMSVLRNTSSVTTISFATKIDYGAGSTPQCVAIGDLNADGKPDIAVVSLDGKMSVYKNNCIAGTVAFAAKIDFSAGIDTQWIALGDLDGDGRPDAATVRSYSTATVISAIRNTSSGGTLSFTSPSSYPTGNFPAGVAMGDIDGDGKPEIASADLGASTVSVFRNKGEEPTINYFSPRYAGTGNTVNIIGAGFNNVTGVSFGGIAASSFTVNSTTNLDAIVGPGGASGVVSVTSLSGTGSLAGFGYRQAPVITSFSPASGSVGAKFTIVGTDLVYANAVSFGGVPALSFYTYSHGNVHYVEAVLGNGSTGDITVTSPYGTSTISGFTYIPPPVITSFSPVSGPVGTLATITGANFGSTPSENTVFFGGIKATITSALANSITAVVPAGAMYKPITVTTKNLTGYSTKPFNTTFPGDHVFSTTSLAARVELNVGTGTPYDVALGDLDGDGKLDVAFANVNYTGDKFSVLRNTTVNAALSFAPRLDFVSAYHPDGVSIGDLDGDDKPELVVSCAGYTYNVLVFKNTSTPGNISFAPKLVYDAGGDGTDQCIIADINGDAKPDLILNKRFGNNISILKNTSANGTISFATNIQLAVPQTTGLVAEDFDGDGKVDIATINGQAKTISLFKNTVTNGLISFGPRVDIPFSGYMYELTAGDLNKDGKPDLIVGHRENVGSLSYISVLRNSTGIPGNATFSNPVKFPVDSVPTRVTVTDLNGDDYPDIAAVGYGNNSINILQNAGQDSSIAFGQKQSFLTWNVSGYFAGPWNIVAGDLNGDGKSDLVSANYNTHTVNIFKNQLPLVNQICGSGNTFFTSNTTGANYQWQVNTGGGYVNISNNINYSGTNTNTLQLINIPTSWYEYQYRCLTDVISQPYTIRFNNTWTGIMNTAWENPGNWSCGVVPDGNTDVIISNSPIILNSNAICRTLKLKPGVNFTIVSGYNLTISH